MSTILIVIILKNCFLFLSDLTDLPIVKNSIEPMLGEIEMNIKMNIPVGRGYPISARQEGQRGGRGGKM